MKSNANGLWKVGLPVDKVLLGTEIEDMSDEELAAVAEETTILQNYLQTKRHALFIY